MTDQNIIIQKTEKYARLYGTLSPESLSELGAILADDVVFIDPFNRITGREMMLDIFRTMFATMDNPHFIILDTATSQTAGYIKWQMGGSLKSRPSFSVSLVGMSEVHFNHKGQISQHIDHWDSASQLLAKLPVAGAFIRWLLGKFSH